MSMPTVYLKWVEAELQKGVVVYGQKTLDKPLADIRLNSDTHSGLLLGYAKITETKPVTKEEIIDALTTTVRLRNTDDLIQRIKAHGVTND